MNRHTLLKTLAAWTASGALLPLPLPATAAARATKAEAEALVAKAIAYLRANGPSKAYEAITNSPAFRDRELYVIAYDLSGTNLAHGANPRLVGEALIGMKDPDGKPLNRILVDLARQKGKGWSEEFRFRNPVTNELQRRAIYVERVGETFLGAAVLLD